MSVFCDASGFPLPTVLWSKLGDDGFMNRNAWLNFTNITRDKAGNYACHAKNTCGKDSSSVRTVDVQCKSFLFRLYEKRSAFVHIYKVMLNH